MGSWHASVGALAAVLAIGAGAFAMSGATSMPASPRIVSGPVEPDGSGTRTSTPEPTPCPVEHGLLSVANFNIKAGKAYAGGLLPDIAAAIADWDADVVILQEVDRDRPGSGSVDQAAWLAETLGYDYAYGPNVLGPGTAAYGTAILSRFEILESFNSALPNLPGGEPRGLLRAVIDAPGKPISIYSTHLQHKSEFADLRLLQAQAVLEQIDRDPHPALLGGDFNSGPTTEVAQLLFSELTDAWTAAGEGNGATWPSGIPKARIDFLLDRGLDVLDAVVAPEQLSDHRALRAAYMYDLPPDPECGSATPAPTPTPTQSPTPTPFTTATPPA